MPADGEAAADAAAARDPTRLHPSRFRRQRCLRARHQRNDRAAASVRAVSADRMPERAASGVLAGTGRLGTPLRVGRTALAPKGVCEHRQHICPTSMKRDSKRMREGRVHDSREHAGSRRCVSSCDRLTKWQVGHVIHPVRATGSLSWNRLGRTIPAWPTACHRRSATAERPSPAQGERLPSVLPPRTTNVMTVRHLGRGPLPGPCRYADRPATINWAGVVPARPPSPGWSKWGRTDSPRQGPWR